MASAITGPIAPENNPPIHPEYYQPHRFVITALQLGQTTRVTTAINDDYVIGQQVRLLIPEAFGSFQLNETFGYVVSLPAANQVQVAIDSSRYVNAFIPTPYTAVITGATAALPSVLTAVNYFKPGDHVKISGVAGMTQLNGNVYKVLSRTGTTITIEVDASAFSAYTSGGLATIFPPSRNVAQMLPIGDVNTGQINTSGRTSNLSYIPGSFINIS